MILRRCCQFALLAALLLTAAAWCVSEPMARNWGAARKPGDLLAEDEAVAATWLVRGAAPLMALLAFVALRRSRQLGPFLHRAARGLTRSTIVCAAGHADPTHPERRPRIATALFRGALVAWLLLALGQWGSAVGQRLGPDSIIQVNDFLLGYAHRHRPVAQVPGHLHRRHPRRIGRGGHRRRAGEGEAHACAGGVSPQPLRMMRMRLSAALL